MTISRLAPEEIGLHSVRGTFIDRDGLTPRRITKDDACDDTFTNSRILQTDERTHSLCLEYIFVIFCQFRPKFVVLTLQPLVFIMGANKRNISTPDEGNAIA